jgi:hypothetical protein
MTVIPPNTAWNAKVSSDPADLYRREAARLRMMPDQPTGSVRENLLDVARQYDVMAAQADNIRHHAFGQPFRRRSAHEGR